MFKSTPGKNHAPLWLLCGTLACMSFGQTAYGDETTNTKNSPSVIPLRPDPPPMFDITYTWNTHQNPGVFSYNQTPDNKDEQAWIGIPNAYVKNPNATSFGQPDTLLHPVIIPANPPVITYDLSEDGTLTQK